MKDLIERLEKATGPSRELDGALFEIATGKSPYFNTVPYRAGGAPQRKMMSVPAYTESIDAALTLVPEGWTVANIGQNDSKGWWAELRRGFQTSYDRVELSNIGLRELGPAIALCSAALRARADAANQQLRDEAKP